MALPIAAVIVVAIAMALALAHTLELPGKMRLSRDEYLAVQRIYYPGFTLGGASEPIGILLTIVLLLAVPQGSQAFWLAGVALVCLIAMQLVFWLRVQPVNKFWLRGQALSSAGAEFFGGIGTKQNDAAGWTGGAEQAGDEWIYLRGRWEYGHVARSVFGLIAFAALVVAITTIQSY